MANAVDFDGIVPNFRCIMEVAPLPRKAYQRALGRVKSRLRRRPAEASLHALKGKLLANLGRLVEARGCLERALALNGQYGLARTWLGGTLLLESKIDWAVAELDQAMALAPDCAWAHFYRAACRLISGEKRRALADLAQAVERGQGGPASAAGEALRSLIESREGRIDAALKSTERLQRLLPGQSWPWALRAVAFGKAGRTTAALAAFDRALSGGPVAWMLEERSLLLEGSGRLKEALRDIKAALTLEGKRPDLLKRAFSLNIRSGRRKQAVAALRRAAALGLSSREVRILSFELSEPPRAPGRCQAFKSGVPEKEAVEPIENICPPLTVRSYLRALAAEPRSWRLVVPLGTSLLKRGRLDLARRVAARSLSACSKSPDNLDSRLGTFQLALCLGDFNSAEKAGEGILDSTRDCRVMNQLYSPAFFEDRPGSPAYKRDLLRRLRQRSERADPLWTTYFRDLLRPGSLDLESVRAFIRRLDEAPKGRYDWMRFRAARLLLYSNDLEGSVEQSRRAAVYCRPAHWRSYCQAGEALFCLGRPKEGLAEFARGQAAAPPEERADAIAWKGETLLWAGRFKEALALLTEEVCAVARYARVWRGAALLKLGWSRQALRELDAALAERPLDGEGLLWRCETLLSLGRLREAWREARRSLAGSPFSPVFQPALAALARAALGDAKGAEIFARRLPPEVMTHVCRRRAITEPFYRHDLQRALTGLLEMSGGDRRGFYQRRLWMR